MFSKPQVPASTAETIKQVIEKMENYNKDWPLDTMVEIGDLLEGPSRNIESEVAHFNYQDMSNSNRTAESTIRDLCEKLFRKYIWKLQKDWFLINFDLSYEILNRKVRPEVVF